DAFMRTLAASPWTLLKLKNLDLFGVDFNDKDLAQLLGQMRQLESLEVSHTRFGRLSIEALLKRRAGIGRTGDGSGTTYRLCDSVKSLRIDSCADVTGVLIQTLLESCPKMEFFQGGKVTVSEIARGKEWVCQGILDLSIYLEADEDYHSPEVSPEFLMKQRVVFARLGQLTKLRYLDLTNDTEATRTLDLRLSAGMKSLANLKDLDQLFCTNDFGQRTPFDVPEIVCLIGDHLSGTDLVNCLRVSKHLHKIFITRRINYCGGDPYEYLALRGCHSLLAFSLYGKSGGKRALPDGLSGFIAAHSPTLRDIAITHDDNICKTPSKEFWVALSQCSNLKELSLCHLKISDESSPFFRRICCTGWSLSFKDMVIPESFLAVQQEQDEDTYEGQLVFPGPRRIDLSIRKSPRSETLSPYCQAMMIRACSNLDTLQWSLPTRIRSTVDAFMRTLAASPRTLLKFENVDLSHADFNDKDLAQ
ncbi:hypothetical protein BGZ99_000764, partial [Dissophora globulifera]